MELSPLLIVAEANRPIDLSHATYGTLDHPLRVGAEQQCSFDETIES